MPPIANVGDAMRELKAGTSKHIRSRAQAIAVGLKAQRSGKVIGGKKASKGTRGRSLSGSR